MLLMYHVPNFRGGTTARSDRDKKVRMSEIIKVACQALIREADAQSHHLRLEYDAQAARYRHGCAVALAEQAYRHNQLQPVQMIPPELLGEVFGIIVPMRDLRRPGAAIALLRRLASVCKHWKEVVLSTPQLWAFISDQLPDRQFKWAIAMSKALPLHIRVVGYGPGKRHHQETILRLAHRWASLLASTDKDANLPAGFSEALASPTPLLQDLTIASSDGSLNIFLGDGPPLRHLNLSNANMDWSSGRLRGLTHLELSSNDGNVHIHSPTISQLMTILANSPNLNYLDLHIDAIFDAPPVNTTINLPRLRTLTLEMPSPAGECLLSHLAFPFRHCQRLFVSLNTPPSDTSLKGPSYNQFPDLAEQLGHTVPQGVAVLISFYQGHINVETLGGMHVQDREQPALQLSLSSQGLELQQLEDWEPYLRLSEHLIDLANIAFHTPHRQQFFGISIMDSEVFRHHHPTRRLLEPLNMIQNVQLNFRSSATTLQVLGYIFQPRLDECGVISWPFPALKYLDIGLVGNLDESRLGYLVETRWVRVSDSHARIPSGELTIVMLNSEASLWRPNPEASFERFSAVWSEITVKLFSAERDGFLDTDEFGL